MAEVDEDELGRQLQTAVFNVCHVLVPYVQQLLIQTRISIVADNKDISLQHFEVNHDRNDKTVTMTTFSPTQEDANALKLNDTSTETWEASLNCSPTEKQHINQLTEIQDIFPSNLQHQTKPAPNILITDNDQTFPCYVPATDRGMMSAENANINLNIVSASVINTIAQQTSDQVAILQGPDVGGDLNTHSNIVVIPSVCSTESNNLVKSVEGNVISQSVVENINIPNRVDPENRKPHCSMNIITKRGNEDIDDARKVIGSIVQIKPLQDSDIICVQSSSDLIPSQINIITQSASQVGTLPGNKVKSKSLKSQKKRKPVYKGKGKIIDIKGLLHPSKRLHENHDDFFLNDKKQLLESSSRQHENHEDFFVRMQLKVSESEYHCLICGLKFRFQTNLTRHQKKSHGKPNRRMQYSDLYGATKPETSVRETKANTATAADNSDTDASAKTSEENTASTQLVEDLLGSIPFMVNKYNKDERGFYTCQVCDRKFSFSTNLNRHLKKRHGKGMMEKLASKPKVLHMGVPIVVIDDVSSAIKSKYDQWKDDTGKYTCPICKKQFSYSNNLRRHIKNIHRSKFGKPSAGQGDEVPPDEASNWSLTSEDLNSPLSSTSLTPETSSRDDHSAIEQLQDVEETERHSDTNNQGHKSCLHDCSICGRGFISTACLYRHKLQWHIRKGGLHTRKKCRKTAQPKKHLYRNSKLLYLNNIHTTDGKISNVETTDNCEDSEQAISENSTSAEKMVSSHIFVAKESCVVEVKMGDNVESNVPEFNIVTQEVKETGTNESEMNEELCKGESSDPVSPSPVVTDGNKLQKNEEIGNQSSNIRKMKKAEKIDPRRRFKCNECDKTFTFRTNLNRHIKQVHREGDGSSAFHSKALCKVKIPSKSQSSRPILPAPALNQVKKENHPKTSRPKSKTVLFPENGKESVQEFYQPASSSGFIGESYSFLHRKPGFSSNFLVSGNEAAIDEPKNYSEIYQFENRNFSAEKVERSRLPGEEDNTKFSSSKSNSRITCDKILPNALKSLTDLHQNSIMTSSLATGISYPLPYQRSLDLVAPPYRNLPENFTSIDTRLNQIDQINSYSNSSYPGLYYVNKNNILNIENDTKHVHLNNKDDCIPSNSAAKSGMKENASSFSFSFRNSSANDSGLNINNASSSILNVNSSTGISANNSLVDGSFNNNGANISSININNSVLGYNNDSANNGQQHDSLNSLNSSTTIDVVNISHETSSNFDRSNSINASLNAQNKSGSFANLSKEEDLVVCNSENNVDITNLVSSNNVSVNDDVQGTQEKVTSEQNNSSSSHKLDFSNESVSANQVDINEKSEKEFHTGSDVAAGSFNTNEINISNSKTSKIKESDCDLYKESKPSQSPSVPQSINFGADGTPERFPVIGLYDMLSPAKSLIGSAGIESRLSLQLPYSPGRSPLAMSKSPIVTSPLSSTPFLTPDDFQKNFENRLLYSSIDSSPHLPSPLLNVPTFRPQLRRGIDDSEQEVVCDSSLRTPEKIKPLRNSTFTPDKMTPIGNNSAFTPDKLKPIVNNSAFTPAKLKTIGNNSDLTPEKIKPIGSSVIQEEFIDIGKLMKTPEKYCKKEEKTVFANDKHTVLNTPKLALSDLIPNSAIEKQKSSDSPIKADEKSKAIHKSTEKLDNDNHVKKGRSHGNNIRAVSGRVTSNKYRFNCKMCSAKFTFRTNLTRHLKKQHGVTPSEEYMN